VTGDRISALEHAIEAGLDYLLAHQSPAGSWTDWNLPPGKSPHWTTAYVGYQLRNLPPHLKAKANPAIATAVRWLLEHEFWGGGWGYNTIAGADADSTAYAILFLTAAGQSAPESAYSFLARHQCEDGGFATYLSDRDASSWVVSHPDVTPVALLAIQTQSNPDPDALTRGNNYIRRNQTSDGLWHSFWWDSCLYGTAVNLAFLHAAKIAIPVLPDLLQVDPHDVFETALLISSLLFASNGNLPQRVFDLADMLTDRQQADGSWESVPILRVTRRDCFTPWNSHNAGPLFADPVRLFTTATVLDALARVGRYEGNRDPA
jgi:Prenyltransferase and squalene oxidase repeat